MEKLNNDIYNNQKYIIIGCVAFYFLSVIFFFGAGYFARQPKELTTIKTNTVTIDNVKRDTVVYFERVQGNTIRVNEIGNVRIIKDTIIQCSPFVAQIDSVLNDDTIHVSYTYPNNMFGLRLRLKNDSIPIKYITLTQYQTKVIERPLWLDVLSHSGAFGLGLTIGLIK